MEAKNQELSRAVEELSKVVKNIAEGNSPNVFQSFCKIQDIKHVVK